LAVVVEIGEIGAHPREGLAVLIVSNARQQPNLGERAVSIVVIQEALHGIVGNKNIDETIAVVVREGYSQSLAIRIGDSRLGGNVGEGAVAIVAVENVGNTVIVVGMTIGAVTRSALAAVAVGAKSPIDVTGHEQVELAVIVVVEESGARAPPAGGDSGRFRDVGERAISVVVVQRVAAVVGHVDIFEAVVVIVAHGDAHSVVVLRHSGEARLFRDVGKRAVGVLVIEPVRELPVGLVGELAVRHGIVDLCAIDKEDVEPSIVVVIQQCYAASHGLDQVLVRGRGVFVFEIDSRGLGDVRELHFGGGSSAH